MLLPTITELFPVVYKPANLHESYILHLFQMISYLPAFRVDILGIIVDHLVKLDVSYQMTSEGKELALTLRGIPTTAPVCINNSRFPIAR